MRELAFAVHGQASGIARLASAPVGVLRRTQERLGHAVQQVKQKVAHTSEEIKDKACEVWDKSCEKANEIKENVAAKLKKPMGEVIAEAQAQEKTYVERYAPDRAQTGKTERLEQQREQLQAAELAGAVR